MTDMLFIFDIPVYRLPKEKYYAERESSIEKQMYGTDPNKIARRKAFYEHNKDSAILFRDHLEKTYGGPWDFNEVVGYKRRRSSKGGLLIPRPLSASGDILTETPSKMTPN
jgi:nuclear transport factor 2 (NTF2) superfamily protein